MAPTPEEQPPAEAAGGDAAKRLRQHLEARFDEEVTEELLPPEAPEVPPEAPEEEAAPDVPVAPEQPRDEGVAEEEDTAAASETPDRPRPGD